MGQTAKPLSPAITSPDHNSYDNDGSFVLRGTAEPGAIVWLYEGTTRLGIDEADLVSGAGASGAGAGSKRS